MDVMQKVLDMWASFGVEERTKEEGATRFSCSYENMQSLREHWAGEEHTRFIDDRRQSNFERVRDAVGIARRDGMTLDEMLSPLCEAYGLCLGREEKRKVEALLYALDEAHWNALGGRGIAALRTLAKRHQSDAG